MSTTTTVPTTARTRRDISPRTAALGALGFVGVVVAQNVLRGANAPANDAAAVDVLAHYADHRTLTTVLAGTFVAGGSALTVFLGGTARRLLRSSRPGWAATGLIGATSVMGLFAVVVGAEEALSVVAGGPDPDLGAISGLWALHNSIFTVLDLFIALALLGLSRAGVAAGITPPVFEKLGPVGAALLAVAAVAGPAIAAGDAMPAFGLGGLGFLVWLAFLATTGIRGLRGWTDVQEGSATL